MLLTRMREPTNTTLPLRAPEASPKVHQLSEICRPFLYRYIDMFLYKNGLQIPESLWQFYEASGALNNNVGVVGSRIVVSNISDCFLNFGAFLNI